MAFTQPHMRTTFGLWNEVVERSALPEKKKLLGQCLYPMCAMSADKQIHPPLVPFARQFRGIPTTMKQEDEVRPGAKKFAPLPKAKITNEVALFDQFGGNPPLRRASLWWTKE